MSTPIKPFMKFINIMTMILPSNKWLYMLIAASVLRPNLQYADDLGHSLFTLLSKKLR